LEPYCAIDCASTAHDVTNSTMMSLTAEWRHPRTDHCARTSARTTYLTRSLIEPYMYKQLEMYIY